jgi:hypothetical protein
MQADRILVHWLDREMNHYGRVEERVRPDVLVRALEQSLLLAVLTSRSGVIVPAASLFENPRTPPLLDVVAPFREAGLICFAAGDADADQFLLRQASLYGHDHTRGPAYCGPEAARLARTISAHWIRKQTSTVRAITTGWMHAAETRDATWLDLVEPVRGRAKAEAALARAPTLLNGVPPLADYTAAVAEAEAGVELGEQVRTCMNSLISRLYVGTHAQEYGAAVMTQLPFFGTDEYVDRAVEQVPMRRMWSALQPTGVIEAIRSLSPEALLKMSGDPYVRAALDDAATRAVGDGPLFSPAEVAAVNPRRSLTWPPLPVRSAQGRLRSRAGRYVEGIARTSPDAGATMNTFNFGDNTVFSGTMNFGGTQYVVQEVDGALAAARAVVAALLRTEGAFDDLMKLDAAVTANGIATAQQVEQAVKPELEKADPSRRSEIAERLATGAASGLVVQGVLAALHALGV